MEIKNKDEYIINDVLELTDLKRELKDLETDEIIRLYLEMTSKKSKNKKTKKKTKMIRND